MFLIAGNLNLHSSYRTLHICSYDLTLKHCQQNGLLMIQFDRLKMQILNDNTLTPMRCIQMQNRFTTCLRMFNFSLISSYLLHTKLLLKSLNVLYTFALQLCVSEAFYIVRRTFLLLRCNLHLALL
jgi:hypothetical protein